MSAAHRPGSPRRSASDTLTTAGSVTVASVSYGYNAGGYLTSKTTTGFAGSSANTYGYDQAGRLTSWTSGSTTTGYAKATPRVAPAPVANQAPTSTQPTGSPAPSPTATWAPAGSASLAPRTTPSPAHNVPPLPISCIGAQCPNPYAVLEAITGYSDLLGCLAHGQVGACARLALLLLPYAGKAISAALDLGKAGMVINTADDSFEAAAAAENGGKGVWSLYGTIRGKKLEDIYDLYGKQITATTDRLPPGFKTFDFFDPESGKATSVKSIDLINGKSYQTASGVRSEVTGYVNAARDYTTWTRSGYTLNSSRISTRVVDVLIPYNPSMAQMEGMADAWQYAREQKVIVNYIQVAG